MDGATGSGPEAGRSRKLLLVVGPLTSVFFLAVAASRLDLGSVLRALHDAKLVPWLPLGVASYLTGHVLRGVRCRLLVSKHAFLSTWTASNVVVVGYAVNNILPARLGEVARSSMLAERTGMPFFQAMTVTFLERVLDGLVIVGLAFFTTLMLPVTGWLRRSLELSGVVFGVAGVAVLLALVVPQVLSTTTSSLASVLEPRWHDALVRLVTNVTNGVSYLKSPPRAAMVLGLSVVIWLCEAGMFLALFPAFDLPLRPAVALFAMTVTNLGILVPSSPGFIGPFHFFCMTALTSVGVAEAVAFGYAGLVHLAFFVPITLWGVLAIFRYGVELGTTLSLARKAKSLPSRAEELRIPVHVVASLGGAHRVDAPATRYVLAIIEAVLGRELDAVPAAERATTVAAVADFVNGQIDSLPAMTRLMFNTGLLGFRLFARVTTLRGFCTLPIERRQRLVEAWAFGGFTLGRQLFRVVRSTALLAFFERDAVIAALGDAAPQRRLELLPEPSTA